MVPTPQKQCSQHVAGGIVQGDVVVERRVDGARAETVGDAEDEQHPKFVCEGKADKGDRR